MKKINVADMTLGNASKHLPIALGFKEKLEIARNLDKLGVNVIELCPIEDPKTDSLLIRTISSFIKYSTISIAVKSGGDDIAAAYAAVSGAAHPRLSVTLSVSPPLMEYTLHEKPAAVLERIKATVAKCASYCPDVEFCAVDATRAEDDFLKAAITAAIESGATVITVSDNQGSSLPSETENFIKKLYKLVPALDRVRLGFMCENGYGLGLSSLITAAVCGAEEIKIAVASKFYTSLDRFAEFVRSRGDNLKFGTSLSRTELERITKQIAWIASETRNDGATSFDKLTGVPADKSATVNLTKNDDIKTVNKAVKKLGYDLSDEDKAKVFEEFMRVAKKKDVSPVELDAIIASSALQVPQTYKVISYVINSGNVITASANISLEKCGEELRGIACGDGPVDAAFLAIEQIIGHHYELDDFQIQAISEGRGAVGSAVVKLRSAGGKLYSGKGVSTDIIGASVRAYVAALNKIVYEEN